jgi:hypothetical protein
MAIAIAKAGSGNQRFADRGSLQQRSGARAAESSQKL